MTPLPPWMIREMERIRQERGEQDRPCLRIEDLWGPPPREREEQQKAPSREPIVIEF